jgi:hypothetical protein
MFILFSCLVLLFHFYCNNFNFASSAPFFDLDLLYPVIYPLTASLTMAAATTAAVPAAGPTRVNDSRINR